MNDSCKQQILNSLNICDWNHVKETNDAQEAYSKFSETYKKSMMFPEICYRKAVW